jgi:hypothetical protein
MRRKRGGLGHGPPLKEEGLDMRVFRSGSHLTAFKVASWDEEVVR